MSITNELPRVVINWHLWIQLENANAAVVKRLDVDSLCFLWEAIPIRVPLVLVLRSSNSSLSNSDWESGVCVFFVSILELRYWFHRVPLVLVLRSSNSSSRNSQGINISLLRNQLEIEDRLTSGLVLRPSNSSESSSRTRASYSRTCRSSKSHSLLYTFVWQLVKSKKKITKKEKKSKQLVRSHPLDFLNFLLTFSFLFFLGSILTYTFRISCSENEKKDFLCSHSSSIARPTYARFFSFLARHSSCLHLKTCPSFFQKGAKHRIGRIGKKYFLWPRIGTDFGISLFLFFFCSLDLEWVVLWFFGKNCFPEEKICEMRWNFLYLQEILLLFSKTNYEICNCSNFRKTILVPTGWMVWCRSHSKC